MRCVGTMDLIEQQIEYYRARAGEYDEWFLRQGRFDHGAELNQQWFDQAEAVRQALGEFNPRGKVLELACGTGLWTGELARYAEQVVAVDAAAEVLEVNRERVQSERVEYLEADLFAWQPEPLYDVVYFSFWLSHVPPERFLGFWQMVQGALAPGGRVFFVDSLYDRTTTANNHRLKGRDATTQTRKLNDGRTYEIVKIYYEAEVLQGRLQELGWNVEVRTTGNYFLYGASGLG